MIVCRYLDYYLKTCMCACEWWCVCVCACVCIR